MKLLVLVLLGFWTGYFAASGKGDGWFLVGVVAIGATIATLVHFFLKGLLV